jgi:ABC-type multidrug transport system fused ATPase/permease subunit
VDTLVVMSSAPYRVTFVRLLGFLRPYKASLAVSTVLAVLSQAAAIAIIVLVGETIDGIEQRRGTGTLAWAVVAILVVGIAKAALMAGRRLISGRQALGIERDMREELYARLLALSFGFYDRHQTGQLMSRATIDLQTVRFFLGFGLIFFFQHVITVVSVTVVLFVVEWRLALIALAITPVIVVVAYRYSHVSHPVLRDVQQRLGEVAAVAEESIVGVHVVKAFAQEERRQAAFDSASDGVFRATVQAFRQRALYVPLLSFLPLLAQAGVLLAAGRMVVAGSLTLGQFFLFNLLLAMLIVPLRSLGMWIGQAQRATAAGERIFDVLDEPEGVDDRPHAVALPDGPGAIRFEGVSFGYLPGRPVLEGIDLEIAAGTTVALIGHTGSGKTTLATLVPRFYDASEGRVLVDGVDVRDVTRRSLRRQIGVISQDPFLFSATVRDNIAFGVLDATAEQVERAARAAQAHGFIEALPQGYDTVIGERGITLSGGQRQRLAIARALVVDPRILVLDDATASVDATTEARIRAGLREAMRGRTTIIIAHRLSTIQLADEVVVLEEGRVATRGTEEELLATSAVYRELYEHGLIGGLLEETA